jgi:hypothetical protein
MSPTAYRTVTPSTVRVSRRLLQAPTLQLTTQYLNTYRAPGSHTSLTSLSATHPSCGSQINPSATSASSDVSDHL